MSSPRWSTGTWLYYLSICLLGWYTLAFSLTTVARTESEPTWLILAVPIMLMGRTYIQLPNCDGRICPSGLFVMYAGLAYGPAAAAPLAALEALSNGYQQSAQWLRRTLFNMAALAAAIFCAASVAHLEPFAGIGQVTRIPLQGVVLALVYFVLNMGIVLGMMALVAGRPAVMAARSAMLWSWAEYLIGGVSAGLLVQLGRRLPLAVTLGLAVLALTYHTLKHYFGVLREREAALSGNQALLAEKEELLGEMERLLTEKVHLLDELRGAHAASLETMALAIEAKDPLTHGHIKRVQQLARGLGQELGLEGAALEALETAALLHDVGKLAIPEYVLYQDRKQTVEDLRKFQDHARLGAEILRRSRLGPEVVPMVRSHHERYDGDGYPDGLSGEEIPLGARILAVADAYDKLTHPRQGNGSSRADALLAITEESGLAFDPRVVNALLAHRDRLPEAIAELGSGLCSPAQTAGAAEEAAFVHVSKASHHEARMFHHLAQGLRETVEAIQMIRLLADAVQQLVPVSAPLVFMPTSGGDALELAYHDGAAAEGLALSSPLWLNRLRRGIEAPVSYFEQRNLEPLAEGAVTGRDTHLYAVFPINLGATGRGLLVIVVAGGQGLADHQRGLIAQLIEFTTPSLIHALAFSRFQHESMLDELTGLGNSRRLREVGARILADALRSGRTGCVVMLDLNGFKAVNDTLGHHEGDRLLVSVAGVLTRCVRQDDLIVRNGGDEFVMVLVGITPREIRDRLGRIYAEACRHWPPSVSGTAIGTSAGVAWFPEDGTTLEALLKQADTRMYDDKRSKGSRRVLHLVQAGAAIS